MKHIIIVGGGVAGLGAAYKVRRAAESGCEVTFTLVEKDKRLGGCLVTEHIPDPETGERYIVDGGSDAFITSKPGVHRVAKLLGIFENEVGTCDENKRTLILKGDKLIELPDGIMMFAPTKLVPLATTDLYSWPAKFRMALDLVIPRKERWAEGDTAQQHDETLESLVVRRMGRESLDRLAEPLVGGVHASDPAKMSLAATFPNLLEMEQQFGSLIKGFLHQRKLVEEQRRKHPPKPGAKRFTFFSSFHDGMQFFTERLADAAGRERIYGGTGVSGVRRDSGGGWRVALTDGSELVGDAVIIATPAWATRRMLGDLDRRMAELLEAIPFSSSATVPMAFRAEDCPFDTGFFGILVPLVERRPVMAVTMSSSKWPDRAPQGRVLLRGFVGGPHNQEIMSLRDEELVEVVRSELVSMLGLRPDAEPLFSRVFRWTDGMPQYTLGHLDRIDELESIVSELPGLALAGGSYRGVGVPNCLESGEKAVSKVLGDFGITLEEDSVQEKRVW